MLRLAIEFFSLSCDCDTVTSVQSDGGWGDHVTSGMFKALPYILLVRGQPAFCL